MIEERSTWEPEREQETSFGGKSQRNRLTEEYVERLYKKLSEKYQLPEERHYDMFEIKNGELYYKGAKKSLTYEKGKLRTVDERQTLGKNGLQDLGFDVAKGKVTTRQAIELNKTKEELPSTSEVANADDIKLQEITKNAVFSNGESHCIN